jgi:hypothetical protein
MFIHITLWTFINQNVACLKWLHDSAHKICSDGNHPIIRPTSIIAWGNMLVNIWEDMFDNPLHAKSQLKHKAKLDYVFLWFISRPTCHMV